MSSIQAAKLGMGYLSANQRPACKNCHHSTQKSVEPVMWFCKKGGFITTAMAACDEHEPYQASNQQPGEVPV
jgi:ribosomal protein L37AE/L43A